MVKVCIIQPLFDLIIITASDATFEEFPLTSKVHRLLLLLVPTFRQAPLGTLPPPQVEIVIASMVSLCIWWVLH